MQEAKVLVGTVTENLPRKGSRWTYDDKIAVVDGTRTIVDWHYETPPTSSPWQSQHSAELKCFEEGGKRQAFFPVPVTVEAGQTWKYTSDSRNKTFVALDIVGDKVFGRTLFAPIWQGDAPEWVADDYYTSYLIESPYWELVEEN